jgi:hypothetical protein
LYAQQSLRKISALTETLRAKELYSVGEVLPILIPRFNRSLVIEARPERLSSDAGAVLLRELLQRSEIIPWMVVRLADPRASDQVTYPLAELLRTVLVLFGQGWRDQDDADALRFDPAVRLAVSEARGTAALEDDHHLPSQPTLSRLLETLSQPANLQVLREAVGELAGRRLRAMRRGHRQREVTLDIDGLPIEVHGNQPGSAWNGHYHQRMYHPLVASVAETGDLLDARLRAGNLSSGIPPATPAEPWPASLTPLRGRSTSFSISSTASRRRCAKSRWCASTRVFRTRSCWQGWKPTAHRMWPGSRTTRCSTAWQRRICVVRPDDHRPNRVCGFTR